MITINLPIWVAFALLAWIALDVIIKIADVVINYYQRKLKQ